MVIGVKCADQLSANHIPVMFSKGKSRSLELGCVVIHSSGENRHDQSSIV